MQQETEKGKKHHKGISECGAASKSQADITDKNIFRKKRF